MTGTLVVFCCYLFFAQNNPAQEHAHHGGERLGQVHFASSCSPAAQKQFDHAVALLHSFEFGFAVSGFEATLQEDPTCGIAYWGITLSQWTNPFAVGQKNKDQLQKGRDTAALGARTGAKTERERDYIEAVTSLYDDFEHTPQRERLAVYRDRMEILATKYQSDHEAQDLLRISYCGS